MARTAVVALGGNALTPEGQRGTYDEQRANAAAMAVAICALLDGGLAGGRRARQRPAGRQPGDPAGDGRGEVPEMPLFSLGAMTEGQLGSLIAIALYGVCGRRHKIAALLSHVIVDVDDPAFDHPTKPIGPFFSEDAVTRLGRGRAGGTSPRTPAVASAGSSRHPSRWVSSRSTRSAAFSRPAMSWSPAAAAGSRWVGAETSWDGVDAVIDKDYAAAELAHQLQAEALVLITGVDAVQLDFGKTTQRRLAQMDSAEAERHLTAGQFPAGSMGPKVRAAVRFVERGEIASR